MVVMKASSKISMVNFLLTQVLEMYHLSSKHINHYFDKIIHDESLEGYVTKRREKWLLFCQSYDEYDEDVDQTAKSLLEKISILPNNNNVLFTKIMKTFNIFWIYEAVSQVRSFSSKRKWQ